MSCNRLASPLPNQQWGGCGWTCPEDPPPPTTNLPNSQKEEAKKEKSEAPCDETLTPKTMTIRDLMASWRAPIDGYANQPVAQPQRAYPSPAGTTANGFRAGSGIVAGDEDTCKRTQQYEDYAKCLNDTDPQKIAIRSGRWITDEKILNEKRAGAATACAISNGYGSTAEAGKDHNKCLNSSVIDTLWKFLTHRKPY